MQSTWRTQVKRITVAVIAATAIAGGVQIAEEGSAAGTNRVSADDTTQHAPAPATPTPSSTKNGEEWG
ncbi:hypothetical protein ACQKM2_09500 [Streptomyces sp. NPDC004126]|uniref:hypothetical protein n=1 Tax=Streptomyces sp. NPDC004126 TaxID=3390695 RepID=UPI003CFEE596